MNTKNGGTVHFEKPVQPIRRLEPNFQPDYGIEHTRVRYSLTPMGWYVLTLVLIGCAFLVSAYAPELRAYLVALFPRHFS